MGTHIYSHPTPTSDPFKTNFLHRSDEKKPTSDSLPEENFTLALNAFHKDLLEFVNLCNGLLLQDFKKDLKDKQKTYKKYTHLDAKIKTAEKKTLSAAPSTEDSEAKIKLTTQFIQATTFANHTVGVACEGTNPQNLLALGANAVLTVPAFKALLGKYGAFLPELDLLKNNQFLTTGMFLAAQILLSQAGVLNGGALPVKSQYLQSLLGVTQVGLKFLAHYFEDKNLQFQQKLAKFQGKKTSQTFDLEKLRESLAKGTPIGKNNPYLKFCEGLAKNKKELDAAIQRILAQKV